MEMTFSIAIAQGSSKIHIENSLRQNRTLSFIVTNDNTIHIHHKSWIEGLIRQLQLDLDDILLTGNCTTEGDRSRVISIIFRKDFSSELEEISREYLRGTFIQEIQAFLRPLRA